MSQIFMAASTNSVLKRHIAITNEHGSWALLLSPLLIGLFAGGELTLASAPPISPNSTKMVGPVLIAYGTEAQKETYVPRIARGEAFFSIGMSEPDTGSDLASVRTTATREGDAYRINGTKIWTTDAHRNHFIIGSTDGQPSRRVVPDHRGSEA